MRRLFLFVLILCSVATQAQSPMQAVIDTKAKAIAPKLIEWRRHIHQNPELGNREFKTQPVSKQISEPTKTDQNPECRLCLEKKNDHTNTYKHVSL